MNSTTRPSAFEVFYSDPSPVHALNLAIADGIHAKLDHVFVANLVLARDQLIKARAVAEALHLKLQTERPFAPQPKGLGLAYVSDNLTTEAWKARSKAADDACEAALAL